MVGTGAVEWLVVLEQGPLETGSPPPPSTARQASVTHWAQDTTVLPDLAGTLLPKARNPAFAIDRPPGEARQIPSDYSQAIPYDHSLLISRITSQLVPVLKHTAVSSECLYDPL